MATKAMVTVGTSSAGEKKYQIVPEKIQPSMQSEAWPHLLRGYENLLVRTGDFTPLEEGVDPSKRDIKTYISNGFINLDKPSNPSSHEVVSWVKRILKADKTGHSGTLDPAVTGCLIVTIDRATRLVKAQQGAGKEYVCVVRFHNQVPGGEQRVAQALAMLNGTMLQRPPVISAVKRVLRVRTIFEAKLLEYDATRHLGVMSVSCEAGTYIRTLCEHMGMLCGVGAHMQELRRTRSGTCCENENMVSLHDVLDANYMLLNMNDESYIRKVIQPLEALCVNYKRIIVKDSTVNAICYGAKLMLPGVLRYDANIEQWQELVLVTTKGEAIAIGIAMMNSAMIGSCSHGCAAKVHRVIMDRDLYPRRWGLGPTAIHKKKLKAEGKLDQYGRPNADTPRDWKKYYLDYSDRVEPPTMGQLMAAKEALDAKGIKVEEGIEYEMPEAGEEGMWSEGERAAKMAKSKAPKAPGEGGEGRKEREKKRRAAKRAAKAASEAA